LDFTSVPHKLITAAGSENNHMLGGEVFSDIEPVLFKDQIWLSEAKKWMEIYLS
jgi:hypothetical protein